MATTEVRTNDYERLDAEVRLMLQVRDDDAKSFEELVNRYQARLLTLMQQLAPQRDQAEDLTQEVFLRVYQARKNYSPQAKFSTWLFTIAHNVASNARRKRARKKEYPVSGAAGQSDSFSLDQIALEASGLLPTRQLDRAEMAEVVQLAVQSLNERQRTALLLAKFEHLSYEEIGQIMDMSVQAIKSLLARARANLREILEPYMQEGARR